MLENIGENILKPITAGLKTTDWSDMYRNLMIYTFEQSRFNNSVFYSIHSWTRLKFLIIVHLLFLMMQILISIFIQCKKFIFYNHINKNHGKVSLDIKVCKDALLVSFIATTPAITTSNHTGGTSIFLVIKYEEIFCHKICLSFRVSLCKIRDVLMK